MEMSNNVSELTSLFFNHIINKSIQLKTAHVIEGDYN